MLSYAHAGLGSVLLLVGASIATAQQPAFHIAARGGATIERAEDNLEGTVPAAGLTAAMQFSPAWRGEIELWIPAYLEYGGGSRHRDLLLGVSAVRLFRKDGVRPFVLAGLTAARTQDEFSGLNGSGAFTRAGNGIALTTGAGAEFPIGERLNVVTDVRVLLTPGALLVRPAVGLGVAFGG